MATTRCMVMGMTFATLLMISVAGIAAPSPAIPSTSQETWLDLEVFVSACYAIISSLIVLQVGGLFQFNIGEYGTIQNDYACSDSSKPPIPATRFSPSGTGRQKRPVVADES